MTPTYYHHKIALLNTPQQKMLCALAYLGRYYHSHLSQGKFLAWMEIDESTCSSIFNELSSKGLLVEHIPYPNAIPVLLVNPQCLSEAVSLILESHTEWKGEIEGLLPQTSEFRLFENLLLSFFDADILDHESILPRLCNALTKHQDIAKEMLALFRYYSHGEFNPVDGGTSAYTYILLGLRFLHQEEIEKAASMWKHALKLNGNRLFNNPITLYFLMAMNAHNGKEGKHHLHEFLRSKHQLSLQSVPAVIFAEYDASSTHQPTMWRFDEYLRQGNQPYHRINLATGLALARLFDFDIPLEIDNEYQPKHSILRHEFQCALPSEPTELASLNKTYGAVASFATPPVASWQQDLDELIEMSKANCCTVSGIDNKKVRLIYLINGSAISIRRQYCSAKNEWDVCRRIQPHEYTASMPEMEESDIAVFNQCKGNLLCMSIEDILPLLAGTERVFTGILPPYKPVIIKHVQPMVIVQKEDNGLQLTSNFPHPSFLQTGKTKFVLKQNDSRYDIVTITHVQEPYLRRLLTHTRLPLQAKAKLRFLVSQSNLPICITSSDLSGMNTYLLVSGCPNITIRIAPRHNNNFNLSFVCYPLKGGTEFFAPGIGTRLYTDSNGAKYYSVNRDLDKEYKAMGKVAAVISTICKRFIHSPEDSISRQQLLDLLFYWHSAKEKPFEMEWPSGASIRVHAAVSTNKLTLSLLNGSWFRLHGKVYFDEDFYLDICDLLKILTKKPIGSYYPVNEKLYIRLTEALQAQLASINAIAIKEKSAVMISSTNAIELAAMGNGVLQIESDGQLSKLQQRIKESFAINYEVPSDLNATLRSYQKAGFEWMARLDYWGAGGCLADDMGLGKTIQTITMLLYKARAGGSLVVAPAAVLYNWADEIERFAPTLNPIILRDSTNREAALRELKPFDVMIVSYSMLTNMREQLLPIEWNMVCLDEAHVIKSAKTEIAKTVLQLNAKTRLAITGTPLQNKALDIWSIFHFLNPGLLGERGSFHANYASTPQQQERLKKVLSPFILRRTKKEVLHELPSKTDIIIRTEMSPRETAVYEAVRQEAEEALQLADSRVVAVFSHIVKARMAACSASLLHPDIHEPSSKLDRFLLLVKDLTEQGKKILVFSQFTQFLEMAKKRLTEDGHSCLMFIGAQSPKHRQRIIEEFKTKDTQLLLVSLQAGGVGLNLTEACVVIHLDAWWNPAIEHQATDRVYRIGQKQNVLVYHLVARNTIEENIIRLHHRKLNLASSILEGTDACLGMSADDLLNLIKQK